MYCWLNAIKYGVHTEKKKTIKIIGQLKENKHNVGYLAWKKKSFKENNVKNWVESWENLCNKLIEEDNSE